MYIRQAILTDIEALSKLHVDTWRTTYSSIIPQDYLDNLSYIKSKNMFENLIKNEIGNILVVEDEDKIVGFASFGKEKTNLYPYKGEINAIYILKEYQRLGMGQALFREIIQIFKKQDIHSFMVWALEDNQNTEFYIKLGGKVMYEKDVTFGDTTLKEIAFAWDKI